MENILFFKQVKIDDVKRAGAIGVHLSLLYQKGMGVPPGFVISPGVFGSFFRQGLRDRIASLIQSAGDDQLGDCAIDISRMIHGQDLSPDSKEEIIEAYLSLGFDSDVKDASSLLKVRKEYVEVRASPIGYMSDRSGRQEISCSNIKGEIGLMESIKDCYSYMFSAENLARLKREGKDFPDEIALVVMRMVAPDKAGYVTAVPGSSPPKIIVGAAFGFPRIFLEKGFEPDLYSVDPISMTISDIKVAHKEYMYARDYESGRLVKERLGARSREQVVDDKDIVEIAHLCKRIESFMGRPQHVRWAIRRNVLFITLVEELEMPDPDVRNVPAQVVELPVAGAGPDQAVAEILKPEDVEYMQAIEREDPVSEYEQYASEDIKALESAPDAEFLIGEDAGSKAEESHATADSSPAIGQVADVREESLGDENPTEQAAQPPEGPEASIFSALKENMPDFERFREPPVTSSGGMPDDGVHDHGIREISGTIAGQALVSSVLVLQYALKERYGIDSADKLASSTIPIRDDMLEIIRCRDSYMKEGVLPHPAAIEKAIRLLYSLSG